MRKYSNCMVIWSSEQTKQFQEGKIKNRTEFIWHLIVITEHQFIGDQMLSHMWTESSENHDSFLVGRTVLSGKREAWIIFIVLSTLVQNCRTTMLKDLIDNRFPHLLLLADSLPNKIHPSNVSQIGKPLWNPLSELRVASWNGSWSLFTEVQSSSASAIVFLTGQWK